MRLTLTRLPDGARYLDRRGRVNRRLRDGTVERQELTDDVRIADVLSATFALRPSPEEIRGAMGVVAGLGRLGADHQAFS